MLVSHDARSRMRRGLPAPLLRALGLIAVAVTVGTVVLTRGVIAQSGPTLTLSPSQGVPGTTVLVSGQGFPQQSSQQLLWAGDPAGMPAARINGRGNFATTITIPQLPAGSYSITVEHPGGSTGAVFTITGSTLTATPAASPAAISTLTSAGGRRSPTTTTRTATATPTRTPTATPSQTATPSSGRGGTASPTPSATPSQTATPPSSPNVGGRRVVGYFPIWAPNSGYTAQNIDFRIVTVVAHFSVVPRGDGSILIPDWGPFPDSNLISVAHAAGAKVVLVVGGDQPEATAGFAQMAASAATRQAFITNLLRLVTANGYDGVDLDWEFPQTTSDRANLTALTRELRTALGTSRSLSIAGPASDWYGQWYDWAALLPQIDWVGAMSYSLAHPSWSTTASHNSALYTAGAPFSVEASRAYYRGQGVTGSKLLLGLPFYGVRFDGASAINQPLTNTSGGFLPYPEIAALAASGWTVQRDQSAAVPYLVKNGGGGVISYDDAQSIQTKCQYTKSQDVGGVILWYLGQDRTGSSQPLLSAVAACR